MFLRDAFGKASKQRAISSIQAIATALSVAPLIRLSPLIGAPYPK